MHYILGTSFITPQRLGVNAAEKQLKPNTAYQLIYIQKKDPETAIYTFMSNSRERIEITFSSCREADKMIARFKKENIPDYEAQYMTEPSTDEA